MIKFLEIKNFKVHEATRLSLGALTVLTGANGSGKSSVFQLLNLVRENVLVKGHNKSLNIKGDSFELGNKAGALIHWDIKNDCVDGSKLIVDIETDGGKAISMSYDYGKGDTALMNISEGAKVYSQDELAELTELFGRNFQYLSAFRAGPMSAYGFDDEVADVNNQLSKKMGGGEYVVYYLNKHATDQLKIPVLKSVKSDSNLLQSQVQAWMSEIVSDIKINIRKESSVYKLEYGYGGRYTEAVNTGFGISYLLSIVVALLSMPPGGLILIENPEAHLHPSAQAALMRLICRAAAQGVQVILETHSDHIINGALVNLKHGEIKRNDLCIYYFDISESDFKANALMLNIASDCQIKKAPTGFCDQMTRDLEFLVFD